MPRITNIFSKGANQDLAISKNDNQHSYYSLDFDLVADNGETLGTPHNTKGNSLSFTIPDLPPTYILELDGNTGSPSISINGIGPLVLSITSETTSFDVYTQIINSAFSTYITLGQYGVFYNNEQVYIIGYTVNPNVLIGPPNQGLRIFNTINAQSNLSIIGWGVLDEDIIIFTTSRSNTLENPINTIGQIWRVQYDDITNTVKNISGNSLTPQYHLIKNDIFNFSLANEIYTEVIGRVESSNKGNIYWTDGYNNPGVINIYNSQVQAIPPALLSWRPSVDISTPLITNVLNGGNLLVGKYQFAYLLYSQDGKTTSYSPLSRLASIIDEPLSNEYYLLDGAEAGTFSNKSIEFLIPNIDTRYDYIKIAVVKYELENVPQVFSIIDQPITDNNMTFVYTGNENSIAITLQEFLNPNISFDTVKSFTQKKNRLYPANTTTKRFEINWDARAYRFNSSQQCRLYSRSNPTPVTYLPTALLPAGALYDLIDTADAVNAYNDESGTIYGLNTGGVYNDWLTNHQYKFKSDGVTLGGSGVNVSYDFFIKTYTIDQDVTNIPRTSPFINVSNTNSGGTTQPIYNPSTGLEPSTDGYDGIKNPMYSMLFPSYARGEVYPFGIVAYNTKGQQSFVQWVADIRIPEPWEDSDFELTNLLTNSLEGRAIGVNFTINTSSFPSDITGFRIVRCERKETDKTRLGIGLTFGLTKWHVKYATDPQLFQPFGTDSWIMGLKTDTNGMSQINFTYEFNHDFETIVDPGIDVLQGSEYLGLIKFPDFDFDKYQVGSSSHIKRLSQYTITNSPINGNQNGSLNIYEAFTYPPVLDTVSAHALLHKLNIVSSNSSVINNINAQTSVGVDGQILSNFSPNMGGVDYNHVIPFGFYNSTPVSSPPSPIPYPNGLYQDNEVASLGTKMLLVDYNDSMTYSGQTYSIVSLCRFNSGQYGGPWRSSRYNRIYQSCSDFIPKDLYNQTSQSIQVFEGDVYVTYYITPISFMHWKETYGIAEAEPSGLAGNYNPVAATQFAWAIAFPTEASFNVDYRHGDYFNKDQVNQFQSGVATNNSSYEFARFLYDSYLYNDVYSQENNLLSYVSKPFLLDDDEHTRVRVWASKVKFDREIIDSWTLFPSNDFIDVEGTYGAINKIINLKESLYAYQDRAFSLVRSEELATVPSGQDVLEAGTGSILSRYDYISKDTGVFHQHSVFTSPSSIYHFDVRLQKMFKFSGSIEPLTDIQGLSAFFRDNIRGDIKITDQVLLNKGIHGAFDTKYNKAYMTFESTENISFTEIITSETTTTFVGNFKSLLSIYNTGQTISLNNTAYVIINLTDTLLEIEGILEVDILSLQRRFTIAYNELLQSFEGWYSFTPNIYLGTGKRLFSANPFSVNNSVYIHNIGDFGKFYNLEPSISTLRFISNYPDQSKVPTFRLDNFEFWTEVINNQNQHITLESITGMKVENNYQTTGNTLNSLTLGPQGNFQSVDFERTWRVNQLYDQTNPNLRLKPYLRDKFSKITLFYDNALNRDFKLHDFSSNITLS